LLNHANSIRSTIRTLLVIATAITALGIIALGRVIPKQPQNEALSKDAVSQSALAKRQEEAAAPTEPSSVARQLERAFEAANQHDADNSEVLEQRAATSKVIIEKANQMLVEKGAASSARSDNDNHRNSVYNLTISNRGWLN
jgi:hypothetical protein